MAEFASVVDAVDCAVGIQQALTRANAALPPEHKMAFRIGINIGDVMVKDGGIFGDGVNVAEWLESLAEPGGVCVTRGVRDHLRDRMRYKFEDLGEHSVKNIARPVRAFRILFDPRGITGLPTGGSSDPDTPDPEQSERESEADQVELAFWQSVQSSEDPGEYEEYFKKYPEGAFASLAQARLVSMRDTDRSSPIDRSVELAFWDSIKDSEGREGFEAYLEKYPEGEFRKSSRNQAGRVTGTLNAQHAVLQLLFARTKILVAADWLLQAR